MDVSVHYNKKTGAFLTYHESYYLTACSCGWHGSSEHCGTDFEQESCFCPVCGAECNDDGRFIDDYRELSKKGCKKKY